MDTLLVACTLVASSDNILFQDQQATVVFYSMSNQPAEYYVSNIAVQANTQAVTLTVRYVKYIHAFNNTTTQ